MSALRQEVRGQVTRGSSVDPGNEPTPTGTGRGGSSLVDSDSIPNNLFSLYVGSTGKENVHPSGDQD